MMCEYRGMNRVCVRCGLEGHFGAACYTPRCNLCGTFAHSTDGCGLPCRRCGYNYPTTYCTLRQRYSSTLQSTLQLPASVTPRTTNLAVRSLLTNLRSTRHLQGRSRRPAGRLLRPVANRE
ncbi:hypothetical protein HPB47_009489 [Ixodes persulcatus]|uniref:Uncharacterized protein n=1 Tax=Ixodes persulcatus TaxID=34615 RepID=A0AC60P218_IXOPE|nr:hypothetical protein HPB47_009489 [Ixodes persulcatus]